MSDSKPPYNFDGELPAQDFTNALMNAINHCIRTGEPAKFRVVEGKDVTIDIYSSPDSMKILDDELISALRSRTQKPPGAPLN